ncbi:MAG TPA: VanZ family protein [Bryobacteraceae bacterium]|nr:VanZ family protein [Bryobacteraceae bacterium]
MYPRFQILTVTGALEAVKQHASKILSIICLFVLAGILVAGLWPFRSPSNEVRWLTNHGVLVGPHGTLLTARPIAAPNSADDDSWSLEIWLRPGLGSDSNTILAFFTSDQSIAFSLHQSEANLALQGPVKDAHMPWNGEGLFYLPGVFLDGKLHHISITAGPAGTRIYLDGRPAAANTRFRPKLPPAQLVLGTSPVVNDNWSGELRGLAIFRRELTAEEVARHFKTWVEDGHPRIDAAEHVAALYLFDEGSGDHLREQSGSGPDLYIPQRYTILHEKFLETPWKEFYPAWHYWKNVGINIGGFVPLGFFFCAYLSLATNLTRPSIVCLLIGAATSLTIEILQAWLPTRDSGMTDLITNTLGTFLGIALYRWVSVILNELNWKQVGVASN